MFSTLNIQVTSQALSNFISSEHYIRHGEGKKSIRKIFANVKIYEDEQKKLKEFEELISKEKVELPSESVFAYFFHDLF